MVTAPFRVVVYDKDFTRKGPVANLLEVVATPRHEAIDTTSFTLDEDHPRRTDLVAKGARCVVEYDGAFLMSGLIETSDAKGPKDQATRTFTLTGDYGVLYDVLGWQVPGAAITAQSAHEYDVLTGPAETVVKTLITRNAVTRLGLPVTIATDLGRGATITVSTRMHTLADRLITAAAQAGIGISVRQAGAGFEVDCYESSVYPGVLRERTGVITSWSHTTTAPTVTRVVVGAGGEGTARVFRLYVDTTLEADWGLIREVFVDARDIKVDDPDLETLMTARATEALAAGTAKAGLSVTLAETDHFRYGLVKVGDTVTVEVGSGLTVTEVMQSAEIRWTAQDGLTAVPQLGDITNDPDVVFADALRATANRVDRMSVER